MGKKYKHDHSSQPNAPELHQVLLDSPNNRQPPHNPYYPDATISSQLLPPPPYSDLTAPANDSLPMGRIRGVGGDRPGQAPTSVIIHQQISRTDDSRSKYNAEISKVNAYVFTAALGSIFSSLIVHSMFKQRDCLWDYVIYKAAEDVTVTINTLRESQISIVYISAFLLLVSLIKCTAGKGNCHGCYLFVVIIASFVATVMLGFMTYFAFYSPCVLNAEEVVKNAGKSILSMFADKTPEPGQRAFGESNVYELAGKDPKGFMTFVINGLNFISYLCLFLSAALSC